MNSSVRWAFGFCVAASLIMVALTALCGAVPAVALTYIGGSLGEGPSYWNNVFSASLGTVGLLGVWLLLELGAKVSVSIAEEHDFASGLRMCLEKRFASKRLAHFR